MHRIYECKDRKISFPEGLQFSNKILQNLKKKFGQNWKLDGFDKKIGKNWKWDKKNWTEMDEH